MSFELEPAHPRLRHQKTIIAALIWRYVDAEDADALADLSGLLEEFEDDELVDVPGQVKVGANIGTSLKRRPDGAALSLRSRQPRVGKEHLVGVDRPSRRPGRSRSA
jgi:hypothetical protein